MARMRGTAPEPAKKRLKSMPEIEHGVEQLRGPVADDDQHYIDQLEYLPSKRKKAIKRERMVDAGRNLRVQGDEAHSKIRETDEEVEKKIAFCCHICHCPQQRKDSYGDDQNVQPSEQGLYHRRCCHRTVQGRIPEEWTPEVGLVFMAAEQLLGGVHSDQITYTHNRDLTDQCDEIGKALTIAVENKESCCKQEVDVSVAYGKYTTNRRDEMAMRKRDDQPLLVDKLRKKESQRKSVGYSRIERNFHSRVQSTSRKPGATVVDLFSGIGAGILCLKRTGIKIDTVIHVEHCKVANAVYRDHHGQPDGQKNVFLRTFEQFDDELQDLMRKHGPFDIIIAGPPCVDYATINANRKGTNGQQGSYLCQTGNVIRRIRDHNHKVGHPYPFFLVENVALTKQDRKDVREAFQHTEAVMYVKDSADHTPLARKRTYLSNIPLLAEEKLEDPPPGLCFEDGYDVAGKIFDPSLRHTKAPGLMAHKLRLDDYPRMLIFKEIPDQRYLNFHARTPIVSEREKLMGFPPGYVSESVSKVFKNVKEGLGHGFYDNSDWKTEVPKEYHMFAGDYHRFAGQHRPYQFYFKWCGDWHDWSVKMAPPLGLEEEDTDSNRQHDSDIPMPSHETDSTGEVVSNRKPTYYTEEEYAKRLLGNSFSIPTVEWLLRPLAKMFDAAKYGELSSYQYAWAAWNEADETTTQPSPRVMAYLTENMDEDRQSMVVGNNPLPGAAEAAKSRQRIGGPPPKQAMENIGRILQQVEGLETSDDLDAADV